MEIPANVSANIATLVSLGYRLTNTYYDGVVRMSNGTVGVFIRPDGTISRPHTHETQTATAELIASGFEGKVRS